VGSAIVQRHAEALDLEFIRTCCTTCGQKQPQVFPKGSDRLKRADVTEYSSVSSTEVLLVVGTTSELQAVERAEFSRQLHSLLTS
jgi:hypothetical protein